MRRGEYPEPVVLSEGAAQANVVTRRNHAARLPPMVSAQTRIPVRRSDHPKLHPGSHFPPALTRQRWEEVSWLLRENWR